jgi:DNA-binding NarL/FixJ family response regulator
VDDHQLVVDGIQELFLKDESFQIVGTANNGIEALRILENIPVDLVITDIDMPKMGGVALVESIRKKKINCRIIMITMHNEKSLVRELINIGADGFLLKSASSQEMLLAARAVMNGNRYISSEITEIVLQENTKASELEPIQFSNRELEILQLIAEGFTNREIGEKIHISHRTVDKHRANMMQKIEARNVAELVRYAMKKELID